MNTSKDAKTEQDGSLGAEVPMAEPTQKIEEQN